MSKIEDIRANLTTGYNCGQAIMAAFAEDYGISRETAIKMSMNLGAGCAFRGELCGAVSAALLIYGLHYGTDQVNDELKQEIVFHLSSEHLNEFKELFGSLNCRELLGLDVKNPDDFLRINEDDLFRLKCTRFVSESARILIRNIEEMKSKNY